MHNPLYISLGCCGDETSRGSSSSYSNSPHIVNLKEKQSNSMLIMILSFSISNNIMSLLTYKYHNSATYACKIKNSGTITQTKEHVLPDLKSLKITILNVHIDCFFHLISLFKLSATPYDAAHPHP